MSCPLAVLCYKDTTQIPLGMAVWSLRDSTKPEFGAIQSRVLRGAGVMFTCDAFGAHYCTDDAFDTELEALAPHYRFYYDCLMCAWLLCRPSWPPIYNYVQNTFMSCGGMSKFGVHTAGSLHEEQTGVHTAGSLHEEQTTRHRNLTVGVLPSPGYTK